MPMGLVPCRKAVTLFGPRLLLKLSPRKLKSVDFLQESLTEITAACFH